MGLLSSKNEVEDDFTCETKDEELSTITPGQYEIVLATNGNRKWVCLNKFKRVTVPNTDKPFPWYYWKPFSDDSSKIVFGLINSDRAIKHEYVHVDDKGKFVLESGDVPTASTSRTDKRLFQWSCPYLKHVETGKYVNATKDKNNKCTNKLGLKYQKDTASTWSLRTPSTAVCQYQIDQQLQKQEQILFEKTETL